VEVIRVAGDGDVERLHDLLVAYEAALPEILRHGRVPGLTELRRLYGAPNAAFLATTENATAGCVAAVPVDARTVQLLRLFVREECRGLGPAKALVAAMLAFARQGGYRRVVLDTDRDRLPAAYELYRSFGFRECAPFATSHSSSATFMDVSVSV
jgi:GNAT superfamily N-acetyltransferase